MSALELPLPIRRHRLTVEEYHRMAEAGVFAPDARVELIEGDVIDMAPIGTRHAGKVNRLTHALIHAVGKQATLAPQNPLYLDRFSEPRPDIALLRPRNDFYETCHPTPADTMLIIEVADSSARFDRRIKGSLYARHGIVELWIIDLDAGLVRFYRDPRDGEYTIATTTDAPGITPITALPGVTVDLTGILD